MMGMENFLIIQISYLLIEIMGLQLKEQILTMMETLNVTPDVVELYFILQNDFCMLTREFNDNICEDFENQGFILLKA